MTLIDSIYPFDRRYIPSSGIDDEKRPGQDVQPPSEHGSDTTGNISVRVAAEPGRSENASKESGFKEGENAGGGTRKKRGLRKRMNCFNTAGKRKEGEAADADGIVGRRDFRAVGAELVERDQAGQAVDP